VHYAISEPIIFSLCDLACGTAKQSNGKS
jgi:hypothetical protein